LTPRCAFDLIAILVKSHYQPSIELDYAALLPLNLRPRVVSDLDSGLGCLRLDFGGSVSV
jgi:hypothetical protein